MDLKATILKEHSKRNTDLIIKYIGNDPEKFDELVHLFLAGNYRVTQRAAWPLSYISIAHPEMIHKYLKKLVNNLKKEDLHPAIARNTFRILEKIEIPENLEGLVLDLCLSYIRKPETPIAVRAFALTTAGNLCLKYPEIEQELRVLIEEQLPFQTAAFKVRSRNFMAKMEKSRKG